MKSIFSLLYWVLFSVLIAPVTGFHPVATVSTVTALGFFATPLGSGILANAVDVSQLTEYAGKNSKALMNTLVNSLKIAKDVMVVPNVKNKLRIGKMNVADGVRPFSSTEEFNEGDLAYTDRFLEVNPGKRELQIDAESYRTQWISEFLTAGSSAKKSDEIPFAAWTWDKVIKKVASEINNKTAFSGFDKSDAVAFNAGATYTEGEDYVIFTPSGKTVAQYYLCIDDTLAGESPDTHPGKWQMVTAEAVTPGINFHLQALITAGKITPQTIGAVTTPAEALIAVKKLYRSMPQAYRDGMVIINGSYTDFDFLLDGINDEAKYVMYDKTSGEPNFLYVPGTNRKCIFKPASWIPGRRMIAGPAVQVAGEWRNSALLMGTDLLSDMNTINMVKSELWTVKAGLKFLLGFQVANEEEIRINDQE